MSDPLRRRQFAARRAALRHALTAARQRAHSRLPQPRRRRGARALAIALLLALVALARCLAEAPPPSPPAQDAAPVSAPQPPAPPASPPRTAPLPPRPRLRVASAPTPDWIDEFRLQVGARSPRLARCLTGAALPGRLRFSATVDRNAGLVSDAEIEVASGGGPSRDQSRCLVEVLRHPAYDLRRGQAPAVPERVSLVIEF